MHALGPKVHELIQAELAIKNKGDEPFTLGSFYEVKNETTEASSTGATLPRRERTKESDSESTDTERVRAILSTDLQDEDPNNGNK